jgi:hypothetical protein
MLRLAPIWLRRVYLFIFLYQQVDHVYVSQMKQGLTLMFSGVAYFGQKLKIGFVRICSS